MLEPLINPRCAVLCHLMFMLLKRSSSIFSWPLPSTGRRVIGRWDLWLDLSAFDDSLGMVSRVPAFQSFGKYDSSRHALKSSTRGDAMRSRDHCMKAAGRQSGEEE